MPVFEGSTARSAQQGFRAAVKGCGGSPRRIGWTRQRKDKFSMLVSPLFFTVLSPLFFTVPAGVLWGLEKTGFPLMLRVPFRGGLRENLS